MTSFLLVILFFMALAVGRILYLQHEVSRRDRLIQLLCVPPGPEEAQKLNEFCAIVHNQNAKWWRDLDTGKPLDRNVGEMLMLVTSELAEALEGHRKNLPDDKLPHRRMFEVELADAIIRLFDIAGGLHLDLGGAFVEKLEYNQIREDHKDEHRKGAHGKKY